MKPDIEELRRKYIENPPEGMTSKDIAYCEAKRPDLRSKTVAFRF